MISAEFDQELQRLGTQLREIRELAVRLCDRALLAWHVPALRALAVVATIVVALAFVFLLALVLSGCSPEPVTPSPGLPLCPQACDMLERLECPEGIDPECTPDCERLSRLGYLWADDSSGPECVVTSDGTVEGVRACNVRCQR